MSDAQVSPRKTPSPGKCALNGRKKTPPLHDDYMMYTYKVIPCSRVSTHNWKLCHFSHVGEVAARRRHPSCHEAQLCAWVSADRDCPLGDSCPYAHNAFESWLHPDRYKTTLCSYGASCMRKFCFFAHSTAELRSPQRQQHQLSLQLLKMASLDTNCSVNTPLAHINNNNSNMLAQLQPIWNDLAVGACHNSNNYSTCTAGVTGSTDLISAAGAAADGFFAGPLATQQLMRTASDLTVGSLSRGSSNIPFWDGPNLGQINNTGNLIYPPGLDVMDSGAATAAQLDVSGLMSSVAVASGTGTLSVTPGNSGNSSNSSSFDHTALPPSGNSQQQLLLQHLISLQQQQHQAKQQQQQQLGLNLGCQSVALDSGGGLNAEATSVLVQNSMFPNPAVEYTAPGGPLLMTSGSTAAAAPAAEWPSASLASASPVQLFNPQQVGFQLAGLNSTGLGVAVAPPGSINHLAATGGGGLHEAGLLTSSVM